MKSIDMKHKPLFLLSIMSLFFFAPLASGKTTSYRSLTFDFTNDLFFGTDRSYTGGGKLGFLIELPDNSATKPALKWMPFIKKAGFKHAISFSISENVYTPDDITISDLIPDDQPYAGYLYASLGIHSFNNRWKETIGIDIGVIGPSAFAEQIQKFIHNTLDIKDPKGWHNQLKNEITFQMFYENRVKLLRSQITRRFGFEMIPHFGGGAGNVYIYVNSGIQMRMGWNLPDDFGIPLPRPGGETQSNFQYYNTSGLYFFAALDGQAVLRNIFLDGNTFQSSHRVEKHPLTGSFILGVSLTLGRINFSFTTVHWTKKYTTESADHNYGICSISFSY